MVFSLFTRKDKNDPRKAASSPADASAARPNMVTSAVKTPVHATETQASNRQSAMQTMAKIAAIESEMNLGTAIEPSAPRKTNGVSTFETVKPAGSVENSVIDSAPMDFGTSAILGDTAGAGNLEILGSGYAPVLEEAAILFSNEQTAEAASLLQSSIAENNLGPATQTVWMMLFDVYQALNKVAEFDSLAIDFAARFESSPPTWRGRKVEPTQKINTNQALVVLPPVLDQAVQKVIEQIQTATAKGRPVHIEMSQLIKVEPFGAESLLKTLNAFKKAKRELTLTPAEKLVKACKAGVEAGRRDTSDGIWLLLLEGLRLMGKQQEFEDASIDYCVTYEVSPPSWEPMPAHIRSHIDGPSASSDDNKQITRVEDGVFHLVGDLSGAIPTESAQLTEYAASRRDVQIDCGELIRIEFVAAGQLQNQLTTLRTLGKRVNLVNCSIPVGTLFGVVGMGDVAGIQLRKH